jgi:hypothetical protein
MVQMPFRIISWSSAIRIRISPASQAKRGLHRASGTRQAWNYYRRVQD